MGDEVDGWREVGEIGLGFSTPERQEGWDGRGDPGEEEGRMLHALTRSLFDKRLSE